MEKIKKSLKTFSLTTYYRGMELEVLCVTTSRKKFAQLLDINIAYINSYAHFYDLRYDICNKNPDKLYAKPGMGGEILHLFKKDDIKPFDEYKQLIDIHRKNYPNRLIYENTNKDIE